MDVKGVQLIVTVLLANPRFANAKPRRYGVRLCGSKQEIDEILAAHVLEDIDRKISGGELHFTDAEDVPFDVPTPAGGAS